MGTIPWRRKMATHSSIHAWKKSHGQRSPEGYGLKGPKKGSQRVLYDNARASEDLLRRKDSLFLWLLENSWAHQSDWTRPLWPEGRRVLIGWGSPILTHGPKAVAKELEYFQGKPQIPGKLSLSLKTWCVKRSVSCSNPAVTLMLTHVTCYLCKR